MANDLYRWSVMITLWTICFISNSFALQNLPIPIFMAFSNLKYIGNWLGNVIYMSRWDDNVKKKIEKKKKSNKNKNKYKNKNKNKNIKIKNYK